MQVLPGPNFYWFEFIISQIFYQAEWFVIGPSRKTKNAEETKGEKREVFLLYFFFLKEMAELFCQLC